MRTPATKDLYMHLILAKKNSYLGRKKVGGDVVVSKKSSFA